MTSTPSTARTFLGLRPLDWGLASAALTVAALARIVLGPTTPAMLIGLAVFSAAGAVWFFKARLERVAPDRTEHDA
jgi:hypothetical protein